MNSTKRQKDRTLRDETIRSVGAQYATRDEWKTSSRKNEEKTSSRKNEETKPKKKQHTVMGVTGDGSKI